MVIREPAKAAKTKPKEERAMPALRKKIMARATKSLAPEEMPKTKGPAIGLEKKVCNKKPETERAPPRIIAARMRGSLMSLIKRKAVSFVAVPLIIAKTSCGKTETLPVNRFNKIKKHRRIKISAKEIKWRLFILSL